MELRPAKYGAALCRFGARWAGKDTTTLKRQQVVPPLAEGDVLYSTDEIEPL